MNCVLCVVTLHGSADMSEPEDKGGVRGEGGGGEEREGNNGQQSDGIHVRNNNVYFRHWLPSNRS